MGKLDVPHPAQAFTGQCQTSNRRTAGQQVTSVTPVHTKTLTGLAQPKSKCDFHPCRVTLDQITAHTQDC